MNVIEMRRKFSKQAVYHFLDNNEGTFSLADLERQLRMGRAYIKLYLDQLQDEGRVKKLERITDCHDRSKYTINGD